MIHCILGIQNSRGIIDANKGCWCWVLEKQFRYQFWIIWWHLNRNITLLIVTIWIQWRNECIKRFSWIDLSHESAITSKYLVRLGNILQQPARPIWPLNIQVRIRIGADSPCRGFNCNLTYFKILLRSNIQIDYFSPISVHHSNSLNIFCVADWVLTIVYCRRCVHAYHQFICKTTVILMAKFVIENGRVVSDVIALVNF